MVRVLHELASLDGGGVAKLLYDYYTNIKDKESLKFDFLIYDFYENGIYEEPLKKMGCRIYKIPSFKKNSKASLSAMREVIKNGNYDVVHSHRCTRGVFALWYAKRYGVRKRIIHSHIAYEDVSTKAKMLNRVLGFINRHLATDLFACGEDAARYMWGEKRLSAGKVHVMTNAIDTQKFRYNEAMRAVKRNELGLDDRYIIGSVGRLNRQKNQSFLIEVFKEVLGKRNNAVLVLAGRGEDEGMLKDLCLRLGIEDKVYFLGIRDDIPDLSNAFDLFAMPSLYEGLPVSVVEAQANGLTVLTSEAVTREVAVTDLIRYLPLQKDKWIEEILEVMDEQGTVDRESFADNVAKAGYDIKTESLKMQEYYIHGKLAEKQE